MFPSEKKDLHLRKEPSVSFWKQATFLKLSSDPVLFFWLAKSLEQLAYPPSSCPKDHP